MEPEYDSDDDEARALVDRSSTNPHASPSIRDKTRAAHHNGSSTSPKPSLHNYMSLKFTPSHVLRWTLLALFGTSMIIYLFPQHLLLGPFVETSARVPKGESPKAPATRGGGGGGGGDSPFLPQIRYHCPNQDEVGTPRNRDEATHGKWYDEVSRQWLTDGNWTTYLSVYRNVEFDNWGKTYEQVKEAARDWKKAMYAPVFDNPHRVYSIYESACGVGLNLALTAEILHEFPTSSYQRLELHGNDYVQDSIRLAEKLYQDGKLVDRYHGRMGRFCSADSLRLEHVPSNSFDLVFCGYITPEPDPLSIAHKYDSPREVEMAYQAICENRTNPELVEQMQQRQEDFYARWVREMIRIALPGAPIIVEQVSLPLCEAYYDWGGVSRDFWNASVAKWPVEEASLVFQDDNIMKGRYHVYFRKQNTTSGGRY